MTKQTEAMKLALEALVKALPDMPVHTDWHFEAITALREALAEQPAQQEPVAWWIPKHKAPDMVSKVRWSDECEPLYTSPPAQRTWVGLTDEDISKMPSWIYSPDQDGMTAEEGLEVFARAIEAKLKEKNT